MRLESVDPTDAPAPLTAALHRAGFLSAGQQVDLLQAPPPVRQEKTPGYAVVMLNGQPVRVRTTPPPPLRRMPVPSLPMDMLNRAPSAVLSKPPEIDAVKHDLHRGPAFAAVIACAVLLAGFAAILLAG